MKPILLFIIVIFLLASGACEKAKPYTIDVSRITFTDSFGALSGTVDDSDWTLDPSWNEPEQALFRTDPVDMSAASVATISLQPAYPNPTLHGGITFQFTSSTVTFLRIAITDAHLNKMAYYTFLTNAGLNAYFIPLNIASFAANKNYRIYYSFDAPANASYYKGHGDVSLKD